MAAAAAVAAVAWVLPAFWGGPPQQATVTPQPSPQVARSPLPLSGEQRPATEESAPPQIIVVEDMDSYSIIDLTAGEPVVSFALKDSSGPAYPMPVRSRADTAFAKVGRRNIGLLPMERAFRGG